MENTTPEPNKFLIPIAIVVAGAMIALAIYLGGDSGAGGYIADNSNSQGKAENLVPVSDKDHIVGSINAPVIIVEYSDLECPFCKVFHGTMQQIVDEYDGQVAWVYRHFPIAQLHSKAITEAEATECAAEQGGNAAFWNYTNRVLELTNSNDSLDLAELPKIAQAQGLNVTAFNECLSSGKYSEKIRDQVEDAVKAGARGTPYSIIVAGNRKVVINGAESLESIKAKVDALLK